jgi:hypothetical protein
VKSPRRGSLLIGASVALNLALLITALLMGLPWVITIRDRVASSNVPSLYRMPEFLTITASPFVVSASIALGLGLWAIGRRPWLALADAIAVAASWTVFVPFVFINAAPLVAMPLSILALIATVAAWTVQSSAAGTRAT